MNLWNSSLKPVTVLVLVCLLAGIVLSSANQITAPVIAANEEAANNATYLEALPEADSFTPVACSVEGVISVLRADNGAGWVITAQSRGYGGQVPAAVAFSDDGAILRVVMMSNGETPGLGQKVTAPSLPAGRRNPSPSTRLTPCPAPPYPPGRPSTPSIWPLRHIKK